MRTLSNEDIPSVRDDDGGEHFVTDAVPESWIIHKRDVSKRAPNVLVQIAASGEAHQDREDMYIPRQRLGMKKKPGFHRKKCKLQRCPDQTGLFQQVLTSAGSRPPVPMPMGQWRLRPRPCAQPPYWARAPM